MLASFIGVVFVTRQGRSPAFVFRVILIDKAPQKDPATSPGNFWTDATASWKNLCAAHHHRTPL